MQSIKIPTPTPRLLIGVILILISSVSGGLLLNQNSASAAVYILKTPIAAGAEITLSNLELVNLPANQWQKSVVTHLEDRVFAAHSLTAGEPLFQSDVQAIEIAGTEVSITLPIAYAPLGLQVGDLVDLWDATAENSIQIAAMVDVLEVAQIEARDLLRIRLRIPEPTVPSVLVAQKAESLSLVIR